MSLRCPGCEAPMGKSDLIKLMRMTTVMCISCTAIVSLDDRGRTSLTTTTLAAAAAAFLAWRLTGMATGAVVAGGVILFLGLSNVERSGRMSTDEDDSRSQT